MKALANAPDQGYQSSLELELAYVGPHHFCVVAVAVIYSYLLPTEW